MTGLFMALLSVLLLANVSGAQEQAQHPIDKALEACKAGAKGSAKVGAA